MKLNNNQSKDPNVLTTHFVDLMHKAADMSLKKRRNNSQKSKHKNKKSKEPRRDKTLNSLYNLVRQQNKIIQRYPKKH